MKQIILVTGGARSGKSQYALAIASGYGKKSFIATAQPFDEEMKDRIGRHQRERDASYFLIEEPLDLASAIAALPEDTEIAIIDCVTVWIGNCLHHQKRDGKQIIGLSEFIDRLNDPPCDLIIVTNEVGMGIISDNELSREYRDIIGMVNRKIAAIAQQVILMVSGIPVIIKAPHSHT
jgi:adenosylcobinamide kinase / adenosylcobinamide-phosphate guanylyltransferase